MGSPGCSATRGVGNLTVLGGERRRKKDSRSRGPVRGASPPRGPSVPGSIARLLTGSQRGTRPRRRELGQDPERPTRSRPRLAALSAPQAGPRASRKATEGSGSGHKRQAPVRNGRRRAQRRRQHPSRREVRVLISSRPLHHTEASSGGGATFHKRRTVNKPLSAREGLGGQAGRLGDKPELKWPQGQRRGRTPRGNRTGTRTTGPKPPAERCQTSLAESGGRVPPRSSGRPLIGLARVLSASLLAAHPACVPEVASAGPGCACVLASRRRPGRPRPPRPLRQRGRCR